MFFTLIPLAYREMIENLMAPKHQKTHDYLQLVDLLVLKDNELKQLMTLAAEQAKIDEKINELKEQVSKYDNEINQLQKHLKEAEQILSTAIFQAKQKLGSIAKANENPVQSEELIKYAYRISASHAISAPNTWQQGDLRRPYPTDFETRQGFLGKTDLNMNGHGHSLQTQTSVNDVSRSSTTAAAVADTIPASAPNHQFSWFPTGELHMMSGHQSISLETNRSHKDASQDDASSDSSSSSSSDSQ
jgi:mediator of RNA polymerase II transcription subunit 4